MYVNLYFILH